MARPALRRANVDEATWLYVDCRTHARARHWLEYGHFQRRQRRAAAPAALQRAAAAGTRLQRIPGDELAQVPDFVAGVPGHSGRGEVLGVHRRRLVSP